MQYTYKVSKHLIQVQMLIDEPMPESGIYLQPQGEASPQEAQYQIVRRGRELSYPIGRLFLKQVADGTELTLSDRPFDIPKKDYDLDSKEFMEYCKLLPSKIPKNWNLEKMS